MKVRQVLRGWARALVVAGAAFALALGAVECGDGLARLPLTWPDVAASAAELQPDDELQPDELAALATLTLTGPAPDDDPTRAYLARRHPQLLRDSLAYWMRHAAGMEVGPHHVEWSELLTEHSHLALLAARGHGKSAFWSYAYPLWRAWREPNTRGLLISNTEGQVAELMRIMKDGKAFVDGTGREWRMPPAASLPILADIVPPTWERTWTTERIWFTNGSLFEAKTFGKSFRGRHVQWIVVDDPIKDNSQYSAVEREKSKAFLHRAIGKMLLPARGAQMVVIGTPMHGDDLHADLRRLHVQAERRGRRPGDWFQRPYPGHWLDPTTGESRYLWPALRGHAWHRRERESNALAYSQEIELRPVSDETSLFPPSLLHRHGDTLNHEAVLRPSRADLAAAGWAVFIGVDLAISAEVGADYTVIVVVGVDSSQNRHLVDLIRLHGASYSAQLSAIIDAHRRYGAELVFVEGNQWQAVVAQGLSEGTDLPVRQYTTGVEKHSLRKGVPSLRPLIENGKYRFPRGDEYSLAQTDVLFAELRDFGFVDGKVQGIGNHDDAVMALWITDQAIREGIAWGFRSDAEDEGAEATIGMHAAVEAAELAAEEGPGAEGVLAGMAEADRLAEHERLVLARPARLNPDGVRWRHAAMVHGEGLDGVKEAAASWPADRGEHVAAWNALQREPYDLSSVDPAIAQVVYQDSPGVARAMLRDLLDL